MIEAHSRLRSASDGNTPGAFSPPLDTLSQDITQAEVLAALDSLLSSPLFSQAHRMSRLLRFLVERRMNNGTNNFKEYVIGLEVFDRNPSNYSTTEDPIVRVQIGRLRERLRLYYVGEGRQASLVFSIPPGSYSPQIRRIDGQGAACGFDANPHHELEVKQVRVFAHEAGVIGFSLGLTEELNDSLFQVFGSRIVSPARSGTGAGETASDGACPRTVPKHWLESSVRIEGDRVRASFRLVDIAVARIVWSSQYDHHGKPGISMQQYLAKTVCLELTAFFAPVLIA